MADDFRTGLLRRRNDAPLNTSIRPRQTGHNLPRFTSAIRRHDCSRHSHKQDGTGAPTSLRPDARPEVGDKHGFMREWWRVLPLLI